MQDNKTGLIDKYVIFKTEGKGKPDKRMRFEYDYGSRSPHRTYSEPLWFKRSWCFVLSPEKNDAYGKASRAAMRAYADSICGTNAKLAADIHRKVFEMEKKKGETT